MGAELEIIEDAIVVPDKGVLIYSSNNSGGSWWLRDEDWGALERAGWVVHWVHDIDDPSHSHDEGTGTRKVIFGEHYHGYGDDVLIAVKPSGDRWLGALARSAAFETNDPEAAIEDWAVLTGQNPTDEGCNCCGEPHSFEYRAPNGETKYVSLVRGPAYLSWD